MKMKILKKEKQELFNREKINFEIDHEGGPTPSRLQVRELLKKELGTEFFIITYIKSNYGFGISKGEVRAYKKETDMKEFEPNHLVKRDLSPKEKKEKPTEAPKPTEATTPSEEKKPTEETKPEPKKEEPLKEEVKEKPKEDKKEEVKPETKPTEETKPEPKKEEPLKEEVKEKPKEDKKEEVKEDGKKEEGK